MTQFVGDGTWGFTAVVDGDDLVVRHVRATWFGGSDDPNDSGETASGISTKHNPEIQGCALPMSEREPVACKGSPIHNLRWGTQVKIFNHQTLMTVTCNLIDIGPAKRTDGAEQGAIDLTQAAMKVLWHGVLQGDALVDFRILGGAKQAVNWK